MSEWKKYILEDIIDKFIDYRGKTPKKTSSGIPLITAKVVKNGKILQPNEFIAEEDYESWMTRGLPQINDIVLTTEAPLGEVALIKDENIALAQRIITLRGKKNVVFNPFLKYYFQSSEGQYRLDSRASGTTVFGIKASVLRELPVNLPPLPEQKAIAEVLSSLDDKIDLLHRQNKTLEQMAETLFRQWFVEEAKEDWERYNLIDLIETISKKYSFSNEEIIFLNTSDIEKGEVINHNYTKVKELPGQAKKSIKKNDILFSEIRPANGRWAYIDFNADEYVVSTKLMVLRSTNIIKSELLYFYLTHPFIVKELQLIAESRSGTFPQITFDNLKMLQLEFPSKSTLKNAEESCVIWLNKINKNRTQIRTLEKIQDTLLPKLMNGRCG